MPELDTLKAALKRSAHPSRARMNARFFKTGAGEYGEGDRFIGVSVPDIRRVIRRFAELLLSHVLELLRSPVHEERLAAVLLMVEQFGRGDATVRKRVYRAYLNNVRRVNNWDLVDLSAPRIVGAYMLTTRDSGAVLVRLAKSRNLWERRVSILATYAFIVAGRPQPTFNIARILLHDREDLIHKAVGWMLREVGKRIGQDTEEEFLYRHYRTMPRTMLRYAIERFPERTRRAYLEGRVESVH